MKGIDTFNEGSHFVFASETCIPIVPLDMIIKNQDIKNHNSWVNYRFEPDNGYAKQKQVSNLV